MITREQCWNRRPAALTTARSYNIPGYGTEDLADEALIHLVKRSDEANAAGEEVKNFIHWSNYIMKRKILDLRRGETQNATHKDMSKTKTRFMTGQVKAEHLSSIPDPHQPVDLPFILSEEKQALAEALKQLSPQQSATAQYVLDGRSDADAAKLSGVPLSTYQMRKMRVVKKLREIIVGES